MTRELAALKYAGQLDEDLAALEAAGELDKQNAAQTALGGDKPPAPEQENGVLRWMKNLPKNLSVGIMDAAINNVDLASGSNPDAAAAPRVMAGTGGMMASEMPTATPHERRMTPMMDDEHGEVMKTVIGVRNLIAEGSNTADQITQGVAQFLLPFMGWSKALSAGKAAATAPKLLKAAGKIAPAAAAETATLAGSFDPQAGRLADLVELGKHTEGKFADALNVAFPDGSALNAYIDYMTDRENEGEAEGRFKNVIDGLGGSAIIGSAFKAGGKALKSAKNFSESPIKLPEIGAPEHLAAESDRIAKEALQGAESPHAAMMQLTEQADNVLDDAEHATIKAARDKVSAGLPDDGITVVPTAEGHTVVAGKQPLLTFLKEEDAAAAVADVQRLLGANFNKRAAAEHAKSTDKNFDTLHSFSRVLQTNKDRPVSTHSLLSALERNIKGDTEQGAFYKELLGRLVRKKVAGDTVVSSKPGRHPDSAGHWAQAFNQVEIYNKAFRDPKTLLHTFTHEAVHAATMHEMNASPRVAAQMEQLRKTAEKLFAADADKIEAKTGARPKAPYGFTNAAELVAEIEANPEFRQLMQKTKLPGGGTGWDKYLETIAGILGITGLVATPQGQKEFSKLMMGQKQENGT
ncbi:MAG: hypothetical protein ACREXP_00115 [Steroidobacteraceae bacterium]